MIKLGKAAQRYNLPNLWVTGAAGKFHVCGERRTGRERPKERSPEAYRLALSITGRSKEFLVPPGLQRRFAGDEPLWLFERTQLGSLAPDRLNDLRHSAAGTFFDKELGDSAAGIGIQPVNGLGLTSAEWLQDPFAGIFPQVADDQRPGTAKTVLGRVGLIIHAFEDVPAVAAGPGEFQMTIMIFRIFSARDTTAGRVRGDGAN